MQYEEFLQKVLQELQNDFSREYQFIPTEIPRNNGGVRHSLIINKEAAGISPCIRMDGFFNDYLSGCSLKKITEEIRAAYKSAAEERFDLPTLSEWDLIRPNIRCRLVNSEKNEAMLSECPHRNVLDLAVVYYAQIRISGGTMGNIQVKNEHMGFWGIDEETLYQAAMSNRKERPETVLKNLDEMLEGMFGQGWIGNCRDVDAPQMYVLGHRDHMYGAAEMLDKRVLKKAAGILGKEFIILPSSIHETLLVPVTGREGEMKDYAKIVREVNDTQVLPEEILSYHIYRYFDDTGEITIAV